MNWEVAGSCFPIFLAILEWLSAFSPLCPLFLPCLWVMSAFPLPFVLSFSLPAIDICHVFR